MPLLRKYPQGRIIRSDRRVILSDSMDLDGDPRYSIFRSTRKRGREMFGIGFQEMLVILVVVLIFFGPKRLPDLAKSLGKGIAEFKKASEEVRKGIDEAVRESENEEPDIDPPSPGNKAGTASPPPGDATGIDPSPSAANESPPPPPSPKG
jgi:TatA/E family protein of Tat protein translocase